MIPLLMQLATANPASIADCRLAIADCPPQSSIGILQSTMASQDTLPVVTLAQALEGAVHLNPDYVRALSTVSESDWIRKMARVAFFAPTVSVGLDVTRYSIPFFNIGTGAPVNTSVTARLDARYELFSARKFTDLGRTQAELENARSTEVQQRFAAALLTESAYYSVLADQELARVARERVDRAEQQLIVTRARVSAGAVVQTDSLQIRLELARAQVGLLRQESALRVSRLELGRRIGLDGPAAAAPYDAIPAELPLTLPQAITMALDQGPAYRAARARERAASAQLKGFQGVYLPTLNLAWSHTRFDDHFFPSARNVSALTLSVALPIWNNGVRELQVIQARADRDVARAFRHDLERAAARDVTLAYDAYETARAAVGLAQAALVVARENYRVQDARYRSGATTILDLLTAQTDLIEADAGLVDANHVARTARALLEAILGTRLSREGGSQ